MAGAPLAGPPPGPAAPPGPSHSPNREPQRTPEPLEGGSSHTGSHTMRPHVQPRFSHVLAIFSHPWTTLEPSHSPINPPRPSHHKNNANYALEIMMPQGCRLTGPVFLCCLGLYCHGGLPSYAISGVCYTYQPAAGEVFPCRPWGVYNSFRFKVLITNSVHTYRAKNPTTIFECLEDKRKIGEVEKKAAEASMKVAKDARTRPKLVKPISAFPAVIADLPPPSVEEPSHKEKSTEFIRRSLLNEDEYGFKRARRPSYYDEGLEKTRQTLNEKISQLNSAIDNVSTRLRGGNNLPPVPAETDVEEAAL
ncbi:hypothetical protein F511_23102 [Dorcoceras hygrometricum]|uniref:Uncharacterized protein n=1 Tax=Dorcoceras hygrometricum TaxID=472368 RepID=A0A2Z7ADA3_9LAMI|nr:hypothetical protein F511_23102 [Dorcoceras hygrometricum]